MSIGMAEVGLTFGISLLTAALGAVILWTFGASIGWLSAGVMVGSGLAVIAAAWVVGAWLRNRQRRCLADMRDSALW